MERCKCGRGMELGNLQKQTCTFFNVYFHILEKQSGRDTAHTLVHSLNVHDSWNWARLEESQEPGTSV